MYYICINVESMYKYRLMPTMAQEIELNQHIGNVRWLYNYVLDLSNKYYAEYKKG